MSETVVAEGVVRVDKSLIMELWICCGKGVGITLCVHSFSMAYPQRNGTYPRCSRPFEGKRWSTVSGTLQRVIKAIKQLLQKGWPGNRVYWKDIFFSFYTSGHLSPSIPTNTLPYLYLIRHCLCAKIQIKNSPLMWSVSRQVVSSDLWKSSGKKMSPGNLEKQ